MRLKNACMRYYSNEVKVRFERFDVSSEIVRSWARAGSRLKPWEWVSKAEGRKNSLVGKKSLRSQEDFSRIMLMDAEVIKKGTGGGGR